MTHFPSHPGEAEELESEIEGEKFSFDVQPQVLVTIDVPIEKLLGWLRRVRQLDPIINGGCASSRVVVSLPSPLRSPHDDQERPHQTLAQ